MTYVLLICAFAAFVVIYLIDVMTKSTQPENLLLVMPVSCVALVLLAADFTLELRRRQSRAANVPVSRRALGQVGLFLAFPAVLSLLRFDGATVVFLFASLLCLGETRLWVAGSFAVVFGVGVTVLMDFALPIEVPLIVETFYD